MSGSLTEKSTMKVWDLSDLPPSVKISVWVSIIMVFAISILDLAGWMFNITFFKSILPQWEAMKKVTAICFLSVSTGLIIIQTDLPARFKKILSAVLASFICLVSILTIYTYIYSLNNRVESPITDVPLFAFFLGHETRMSIYCAFNLFMIGCILFLLTVGKKKISGIAHALIIPVSILSYFILISYLLGVGSVNTFLGEQMPLNTDIAFCFICISILLLRPDTWLLKVFTSADTGGIFARRLLPALVILPLLIGWLRIKGEHKGLFISEEGVILVAITYTVCFVTLIWLIARSVNLIDMRRHTSEMALQESEEKFKFIATNTPDNVIVMDSDLRYSYILNPQLGYMEKEMIGKTDYDLLSEKDATYITKIKKRVLETGNPEYVFTPLVTPNGITEYYEGVYLAKRNKEYAIDGIIGYFRNVTEQRTIEKALKESEEQYRLLFESMTEGFALHEIVVDENGIPCDYIFLSVNPAFEKHTGLQAKDLIGKRFNEVLNNGQKFWIETYGKVALTGESIDFENYSPELNRYFKVSAFSPRKGYFAVLIENITYRVLADKELQRTKNYLENLINYASAPIVVWNPIGEIQLFNHAFERLTGYTAAEVEGKKLEMLFPKASLEESNAKIKEALVKNLETIEIPILTKYKRIRVVLWNSANVFDSDHRTVLSIIAQGNDITERIKAEEKVEKRTRDLENANILLNRELNDRIQVEKALKKSEVQLKELIATKDKFFNIVAHDLKNPFTSLLGSSEVLYQNINKMDHEKIKTLALIINDASKSGYSILQNLLDWSRSQTGLLKINPEKIDLKDLINEHIMILEQVSKNKDIEIRSELEEAMIIYADKNMLRTVLRNLLSNALKYSYRNGKIGVNAVADDSTVIISVKDNGIGIPAKNIGKIFRIEAKFSLPGTENETGTGLGLKLCKEFVEKLGGRIWVESVENEGSEFKFSIPSGTLIQES